MGLVSDKEHQTNSEKYTNNLRWFSSSLNQFYMSEINEYGKTLNGSFTL
jgi:hypothetical protein